MYIISFLFSKIYPWNTERLQLKKECLYNTERKEDDAMK